MKKLKFYDVAKKKSFFSENYKIEVKNTSRGKRYFAVAETPSGSKAYRTISKETAKGK